MSSLVVITILLAGILICLLGSSMFIDVAFRPRQVAVPRRRVELPWLTGEGLHAWAVEQGRKLTAARLKNGTTANSNIELAWDTQQFYQSVVNEVQQGVPRADLLNRIACRGAVPPEVTIPEALAIVDELEELSPNILIDVQRHVGAIPGGTSRNGEVPGCALLGETGYCVCSFSQPLACVNNCRAGFDSAPAEKSWAETLQQGLRLGIRKELETSGLDATSHPLAETLRVAFLEKDAAARWVAGERLI